MTQFDLLVRGGEVVHGDSVSTADIGIVDGAVAEIGPEVRGSARREIDARGHLVLPGVIDPHVHFNEPGRSGWEGWATGSAALASGGGTTCLEMPLNAHPPTLDRASFAAKAEIAAASSAIDFGLWGGLTPDNLDHLDDLAGCGVVGFKAFMSSSGTSDFRHADDATLYHGMRAAARLGLPVAVHAENNEITADLAARARAKGQVGARDYLASRPLVAENEAIGRAIALAADAGCALHIVHVSSGEGVRLVMAARAAGVDVTCETCPHYLFFTGDDVERIGPLAKCAPPLRDAPVRDALRAAVIRGDVDFLASDHSPAPPSMKTGDDFFAIWGGISGCQHLLAAAMTGFGGHALDPVTVARLLSGNVAARFRLRGKGAIVVGNDADLTWGRIVNPAPLAADRVRYRHPASIWDEVAFRYRTVGTAVRGTIVVEDGRLTDQRPGRLVRPFGLQ